MRRTDPGLSSPLHRLAALTGTVLLVLPAMAGCSGREGQTTQPGLNEEAIPGQATATSTAETEYTNDEEGAESEGSEPGFPSPPQTIIAPDPEESEAPENPEEPEE